jgi:hypothetical protein
VINPLRGEICLGSSIKIQFLSDRGQAVRLHYKVYQLMLCGETIAIFLKNRTELIDKRCGKKFEF